MKIGTHIRRSAAREDGFTMIVAIMVLFVSSLLVAAVFIGADGDVKLTRTNTNQKEAYYAAMAGISAYRYELNANANYWERCPSIKETTIPGATEESYKVRTLPAEGHAYDESECQAKGRSAVLQTSATATGAFEIESTGIYGKGTSGEAKRSLVATFTHPGYLNYAYLSNFELADPETTEETTGVSEKECEYYYEERKEKDLTKCEKIPWITGDKIEGPFHTNDAADIDGDVVFGRAGHDDVIEMDQGYYEGTPTLEGGSKITKGATLLPPEAPANELLAEAGDKFEGRTIITLEGTTMTVADEGEGKGPEPKPFPANGVIAVVNTSAGCPVKYNALNTNYVEEKKVDASCGNVYIKGTYSKSLTIIAQEDVIVAGNLTTEGGESGGEPKGDAALGLIAIGHARLYHPVAKEYKVEQSTPATKAPTIFYKEENPLTRPATLEQNPTVTEETSEQAPTVKSKTLEQTPTTKETTVEEAPTGQKKETCKTGFTYSKTTKKCVGKVVEESCPAGYTLTNKKCTEKITEETCNAGYTLTNQKCIKKVIVETCPSGYTLTNKICTKKITEEYCKAGYTLGTNKKCVSIVGEETCSSGYKLNGKNLCVASCPTGETYAETEGLCLGKCEGKDKAVGANCEYVNNSSECDAKNEAGALKNPIIDAAILSTKHSWGVDNVFCGAPKSVEELGKITVWGSIAENWRGRVDCTCGDYNYTKNYKYDERLKTIQPPDFLTPSGSEVQLSRVTAPPSNFPEA